MKSNGTGLILRSISPLPRLEFARCFCSAKPLPAQSQGGPESFGRGGRKWDVHLQPDPSCGYLGNRHGCRRTSFLLHRCKRQCGGRAPSAGRAGGDPEPGFRNFGVRDVLREADLRGSNWANSSESGNRLHIDRKWNTDCDGAGEAAGWRDELQGRAFGENQIREKIVVIAAKGNAAQREAVTRWRFSWFSGAALQQSAAVTLAARKAK